MRGIDGAATLAAYRVMQVSLHLSDKVPFWSYKDVDTLDFQKCMQCDHALHVIMNSQDLISLGKFSLFKGKLR
ncbi:hypothetical protein ASE07_04130 [Noviherbaspirillum sp. Root189]|nr:hypothetical protein ASE07_04130 [Noviherbaspirillum sp. Root189]